MGRKIYQKDGVNYIEKDGTVSVLEGQAEDEKIRQYMKENNVDYETACIYILDAEDETNVEMMRQNPDLMEIGGTFYRISGEGENEKIKKYQMENNCSLTEATIYVLDKKG